MTKKTTKEREAEFRKQVISDAAWRAFDKKGIVNTTMQDIAEEAEYALGTIYKLFKSKEEIVYRIIQEKFTEFNDIILKWAEEIEDEEPMPAMKKIIMMMYDYFLENRKILQFLTVYKYTSDFELMKEVETYCDNASDRMHKKLFSLIEKGAESGFFRKTDPHTTHVVIGGIVMELIWDEILRNKFSGAEAFSDTVISYVMNGIGNHEYLRNMEEQVKNETN